MNIYRLNSSKALLMITGVTAMIFTSQLLAASADEQAQQAREKELQTQLQLEYEKALKDAESERLVAEESMRAAREKLRQVSEQQQQARENEKEKTQQRAAQQAEMARMHEELDRARRQLRETSREIARVDREVARARSEQHTTSFAYRTSNRPVIGVILGKSDELGVEVLGVSPDGPAERGGIRQGDVIVAVGGQVLASIKEADNAGDALRIAMKDIKADEPLTITYERQEQTLDTSVVPEIREPISWQTVTRFPSAPRAPGVPADPADPEQVITIERIVVPEIDTAQIAEQIEKLRVQIDQRNNYLDEDFIAPVDREYEFEFHEMSELGDFALHDANVWFGLSMTRGLKLAELDPQLGEYFKTDRGVLVLKAKEDNELQLVSGDVILQVGDTEVNSPAEFMRALRGLESGDELTMDIKRKRRNQKLEMTMPEKRTGFLHRDEDVVHTLNFSNH